MGTKAKIVLFNKPYKVMSQFSRPEGSDKKTLADFINLQGVYPAGRLDFDSEGLLVLTDNGILQDQIAHPKNKKEKLYWVQVEGEISELALQNLRSGVELKDGMTLPAKAEKLNHPATWDRNPPIRERQSIPTSWIALTISEGKNRQVRRMTAAVGFPTLRLIRQQVGSWTVEGLLPGEFLILEVDAPEPSKITRPNKRNNRAKPNTSGKKGSTHQTRSTKPKSKMRPSSNSNNKRRK